MRLTYSLTHYTLYSFAKGMYEYHDNKAYIQQWPLRRTLLEVSTIRICMSGGAENTAIVGVDAICRRWYGYLIVIQLGGVDPGLLRDNIGILMFVLVPVE
ncbi:hypothetical protein CHS0354_018787 [Potamilus streckersoni]|uniref:Uncharacterized protein n=1 Tax=Potamilus streckersoni TaxID=2493646 RepID=A0AAE0WBG4_9BIVA|nr:hypothetical protein CHS0354_018787 [Potamilus streckersoni]